MKICIYKITNIVDKKIYIGQTINYSKRKNSHISHLKNNKHHNEHLQNAWNKYGEENFTFEVVEECKITELDKKEKYYIDFYNSTNAKLGYNLVDGGQVFREFSPQLRKKMSEALKGRKFSELHKKRISESLKGRVIKKESIKKSKITALLNGKNKGQNNPNTIINNKIAKDIIIDLYNNKTVSFLKQKYQVSQDIIYNLMYNKTYIDVLPEIREELKNRTVNNNDIKVNEAITMYKNGLSQNQISKELNISRNTLRKALKELNINTKNYVNQYVNTEVNN